MAAPFLMVYRMKSKVTNVFVKSRDELSAHTKFKLLPHGFPCFLRPFATDDQFIDRRSELCWYHVRFTLPFFFWYHSAIQNEEITARFLRNDFPRCFEGRNIVASKTSQMLLCT
ncbi:unnamed protein product [Haemonchus placei]|uniref:Uncharacterized protein n=1 Tax=Haemonchus placei TaxID=6290 RepID=A0A158QJV1_HAEPC|nr:unnamed protein product [Haemonchus placei]